jgi:hypothetical protein
MRKAILLTAAAAFLAVPAVVQAQDGPTTANVTASATIDGFAEFTGEADPASATLGFGTVTAGESPEILTTTGDDYAALGIRHNTAFTLTFVGGGTLVNVDDEAATEDTIDAEYYCAWIPAGGSHSGDGNTPCGTVNGSYAGSGVQVGELRIGGKLTNTEVTAGTYEATLTVTIAPE